MIELPQIRDIPWIRDCIVIHIFQVIYFGLTGGGDDKGTLPVGAELPISWLGGIEGDFSEH